MALKGLSTALQLFLELSTAMKPVFSRADRVIHRKMLQLSKSLVTAISYTGLGIQGLCYSTHLKKEYYKNIKINIRIGDSVVTCNRLPTNVDLKPFLVLQRKIESCNAL